MENRPGNGSFEALEFGSVEEASVAIERLFRVTEAELERSAHLQRALESRVVIEQAKGVLAERFQLDMDEAFALLRAASRSHRMRLHELAHAVVSSPETPPEVAARLADTSHR